MKKKNTPSKLDELRGLISDLFDNAEDQEIIKQVGAVNAKLDEMQVEQSQAAADYKSLLDDYKDSVLHGGYKTQKHTEDPVAEWDADKAFREAFKI